MYAENLNKTILIVSHGTLLNYLMCNYTNNVPNATSEFFIPENNSISVIELKERWDDCKAKTFIDANLVAYNLHLKTM